MTLRIMALVSIIITVILFLIIVPAVNNAWALEWWEVPPDNRTAEQKAADAQADKEWITIFDKQLQELECIKNLETGYVEAGQCGSHTIEQQLQIARDAIQEAENRPPCKLKNFTGGVVDSDDYDRRCNTEENILLNMTTNIMTNSSRRTVDDGYTYPENATDEEKAAIDAQEFKAWVEAGTPGEKDTAANPYCDLLSTEEGSNTICHDRKDASDITGLYTCNDGTHKKDWRVCKDVSGYEYGK